MVTTAIAEYSVPMVLKLLVRRVRGAPSWHTKADLAFVFALIAAVFAVSFLRLEASRAAIEVNNCIFGADAKTYLDSLAAENYLRFRVHKHALAVIVIAAFAQPMIWLGMLPSTAGSAALAFIQACAAGLVFVFLRRHFLASSFSAASLTVLALATFGTVTLFGIAETYGVTVAAIAVACAMFGELAYFARRGPAATAITAGLIGAVLGLANVPALSFLLVYAGFAWSRIGISGAARLCYTLIVPGAIAGLAAIAPSIVAEGTGAVAWQSSYMSRYSEWSNFADVRVIKDYLASFFVFAFVAPADYLMCRFGSAFLGPMFANPLRAIALITTGIVIVTGIARALGSPSRPVTLAMLGAAGSLFLFYLYFNPDEALLYSPQWTLALVLAAAPGLGTRILSGAAGVAAALCLVVNLPPLGHAISTDPQTCCPFPPATMLEREHPRTLEETSRRLAPATEGRTRS